MILGRDRQLKPQIQIDRTIAIVELIRAGYSTKEIAARLHRSPKTIEKVRAIHGRTIHE